MLKKLKYFENYQNVAQRPKASKCHWKMGVDRFTEHRVATNLQFVKNKKKKSLNHTTARHACNKNWSSGHLVEGRNTQPPHAQEAPSMSVSEDCHGL